MIILHNYRTLFENKAFGMVQYSEPLKNHTYTKLGGAADVFVRPYTVDEIRSLVEITSANDIPLTILGYGSNVIVRDGGIRGVTLSLAHFNEIKLAGDEVITAQSGASLIEVSNTALRCELTGLEFACGIPGSIGGALYMNAGAYGGQIADVIAGVTVLTPNGKILELEKEQLLLGYRSSIFMKENYIILEARFRLRRGDVREIKSKMEELTLARTSKQPLEYPSCGSVFKRPPGYFAGRLIQDCQLQGVRVGGAEVSRKHAGFIVNIDNATSTDYLSLIELIQRTVQEKFNVRLETEVIVLGE
ncbi:UDP-N-acetylmuramate dehydrogenase [Paenibacillus medicaginis]|uniref:UDP-N-acetylenolpyruvoylglucosamine reductase n=1 Tax=Paenibacillus medicaginis TaxID=1470560 RepID=A0ABV5C1V9_9BACL